MTNLKKRILSSHINSVVFSEGGGIFLVGGYLRDLIGKGIHSKDRDFVISKGMTKITERIAQVLEAKIVHLGKEKIVRIVLGNGVTMDFSHMQGDIERDLRGRDYTVNAMGWSPSTGLVDPLCGRKDLEGGLVRGVSGMNLRRDPVRLLRAYRFSGENEWRIDNDTRKDIRTLSHAIAQSPPERITLEFFKLLNARCPDNALREAIKDGLLSEIIPLSEKQLMENLKSFSKVKQKLNKLPDTCYFKKLIHGLSYPGLIRLEILARNAELERIRLSLSRDIFRRISLIQELYKEFCSIDFKNMGKLYDLFARSGMATCDLLIVSGNMDEYDKVQLFSRLKVRGPLKSEEIMSFTGIGPGRKLGKIIYELKRMSFEGKIRNRNEAKEFLKTKS